ncbi:MAG: hypothetical protein NTU53_23035 [Planctomycetota bacterium]|nr:hypothetical protein [Planctomycetota bacterium]
MNIFTMLRGGITKTRTEALKAYSELLSRSADDPKRGDAERLKALLEALGITVADAELDAAAVAELAAARAKVIPAAERVKLQEACCEADAAIKTAKAAWEAEEIRLKLLLWEAQDRVTIAAHAEAEAEQLTQRVLRERPRALGQELELKPALKPPVDNTRVLVSPSFPQALEPLIPASVLAEAKKQGRLVVGLGDGRYSYAPKLTPTPEPTAAK